MQFETDLIEALKAKGVSDNLINDILDSGYMLTKWSNWNGGLHTSVTDKLYGNKGISSNLDFDKFIAYAQGDHVDFGTYPLNTYKVKSYSEIEAVLKDERRKRLIEDGKMVFRGQPEEYYYKRKIPNPIKRDYLGREISITPGKFRNLKLGPSKTGLEISDNMTNYILSSMEPENEGRSFEYGYHDFTRVHQHYINHTEGLDITFEIGTAIYFATHRLDFKEERVATYNKVISGDHLGVIYGMVFRDPPVKKSDYYIEQFDYFKRYVPERILRQHCGLPIFHEYERNIAIADLDFIIYLEPDFDCSNGLTYKYLFPDRVDDKFYAQLLILKQKFPEYLKDVVEYV